MNEKNRQEEIQTRREFFKKAAKTALPVLGTAILTSLPFSNAVAQFGCNFGCQGQCSDSCYGSCYGGCKDSCKFGCNMTCYGSSSGSSFL